MRILILWAFIACCTVNTPSASPQPVTPIVTTIPTIGTPEPSPSSIGLPIRTVSQECLPIEPTLPPDFLANGLVIIGDFTENPGIGDLMVLTYPNNGLSALPDVPSYWFGEVSLDSRWLVYYNVSNEISRLVVLGGDAQVHSTISWEDSWSMLAWLDYQRLVVTSIDGHPVTTIINPFTDERETITTSLPNYWIPDEPLIVRLVIWRVVFDSSLTRVAYMRQDQLGQRFVLFDMERNRELWVLDKWSARTVRPEWSPDGEWLAVIALNQVEDEWDRFELYLVNHEGQAEKWIDIRGYYTDADVDEMSWSPDGRYIAIAPFAEGPFLVVDTVARKLMDYCIPADATNNNHVLWSPDSSQVIVPRWGYPSIVVDLERKVAATILRDEDFRPVGWLSESP
ncbi:MAG: hypothetical protein ABIJ39_06200 [Chloroflexota bacterium]